jgi:hypothetical protein
LGHRIKAWFQKAGHSLGKVLQHPIVQAITAPLAMLGPIGMGVSAGLNVLGAGLSQIKDPNPNAIAQEENEEQMMAEALANDDLINRTQTSNVQRLNQACNVGDNKDDSEQYDRFETQGARTMRVEDPVLSVANMYSSTNNRAARTFQTRNSETKVAKKFVLQSGKLSELQNIDDAPMKKNMDASLGYHVSQSMTEI